MFTLQSHKDLLQLMVNASRRTTKDTDDTVRTALGGSPVEQRGNAVDLASNCITF